MRKHSKKPRSGPTLAQSERGAKVYSISLPDTTRQLWDRFAVRHRCTRSAVIVMALGALVEVEGEPRRPGE